MDCADGNNMSSVFGIKIIKVRSMLEVVCKNIAAVNNLVGLDIVGKFDDLKGDFFLGKNLFCYLKDFRMRSGGCRNGDCGSFKGVIINSGIKAVTGVFNYAYNRTLVFGADEIRNLLAFKGGKESFCFIGIFVAFFYAENVAVCGRRAFNRKGLGCGVDARIYCIVGVDYGMSTSLRTLGS